MNADAIQETPEISVEEIVLPTREEAIAAAERRIAADALDSSCAPGDYVADMVVPAGGE